MQKITTIFFVALLMSCTGKMVLIDDIELEDVKSKSNDTACIDVYSTNNVSKSIIKDAKAIIIDAFRSKTILTIDSASDKSNVNIGFDVGELKWHIPNYSTIVAQGVAAGCMGGMIGGSMYGLSHYTMVYGIGDIKFRIKSDYLDTAIVFNDTASIESNLLDCDTGKTKARARGLALKHVLRKVIKFVRLTFNPKQQ